MRIRTIAATAAVAAAILGGSTAALAASGSPAATTTAAKASPSEYTACITKSHTLAHWWVGRHSCPSDQTRAIFDAKGPKGATGPKGPSGVISSSNTDLGAVASVPTGGSFVTNATQVGTVSLKAGTYLLSLNAKATPPSGGTGSAEVFPEFFVYDQVANPSFTGDLFNVGSGALESGSNFQIDSYFSGSGQVTLTSDTTLHVYAFGYDSDRGAGTYTLDDLSVTATQIFAGS